MDSHRRLWLERAVLLAAAAIAILLFELWLAVMVLLAEILPVPLLFVLAGLVLVLVYKGTRLESRKVLRFLSRLLLVIFTIVLTVCSIELVFVAGVTFAMEHGISWDAYLLSIGALALICMATAGLKLSFELSARYWILLIVMSGVVLLATLVLPVLFFFFD